MKVQTVEQYKIMKEIDKLFDVQELEFVFEGKDRIKVIDHVGDVMYFNYVNGKVLIENE